jgi:microcystin-dependent protein
MGTTSTYGLPYPEQTDIPNVQADLKKLADAIDSTLGVQIAGSGIPMGSAADWPWAASQIPSNTVLPYGQQLTQAAYPSMQAIADASSRPYGGTAGTNFNLPDYRGRSGIGKDDMGGTAANRITAAISGVSGATLGGVFGSEGISLTTAQLPAHSHTFTTGTESADHSHAMNFNTGGQSQSHLHVPATGGNYYVDTAGSNVYSFSGGGFPTYNTGTTSWADRDHVHNVNGSTGGRSAAHTHSGTSDNSGSGSVHQNTQPSIIVNKILRVL